MTLCAICSVDVGDKVCGDHGKETTLYTPSALHMTVTFRSHDAFRAYALNLAALCLWLCEEAKRLGMAVGTLTCMSQSAHVYSVCYNDAQKVIDAHKWPAIEWDQRSTWRVEVYETEEIIPQKCDRMAPTGLGDYEACGAPAVVMFRLHEDQPESWRPCCAEHRTRYRQDTDRWRGLPKVKAIRAVCLTPDGNKTTRVFTGKAASGLLQEIERSGLVSRVGNAMWLGGELVKAEAKL